METNLENTYSYSRLPQKMPIKKLGRQYMKLAGYVKINSLARVSELSAKQENKADDAEIFITLNFRLAEGNNVVIEGVVNQNLALICQRCHQEIQYTVSSNIQIILVKELDRQIEQRIKSKLGDYETIVVDFNEMLDLYQIIEDEIILALPIVIKHDDSNAECFNYSNFTI